MVFLLPEIIFKNKSVEKSFFDIRDFYFSTENNFAKKMITDYYNTFDENAVYNKINLDHIKNKKEIDERVVKMRELWTEHKGEFFNVIQKNLHKDNDGFRQIFCYVDSSPFSYYSPVSHTITLSINDSVEDCCKMLFKFAIKFMIIQKWQGVSGWLQTFDCETNDIAWIMAEFVCDAMLQDTSLKEVCSKVAYKYFYYIMKDGKCIIDVSRNAFNEMCIEEYLKKLYEYINANFDVFSKFNHRL